MEKELMTNSLLLLEELAVEGARKDDHRIIELVNFLDEQTRQLEKEFTTEAPAPKLTFNLPFGDELAAEVKKILDSSSDYPHACLPLAVSWMLRSFTERVRRDIGCNVNSVRFSSGLQFTISFSVLGSCIDPAKSPQEREESVENLLKRMTQNGFVIRNWSKKNHPVLGCKVLPYNKNRKVLADYFSFLGASDLTMEVKTGCIWKVSGVIAADRYPIEACVQEPEGKSASPTLTEADAYRIREASRNYQFVLMCHSAVMDKNLVYHLFLQYMAEIELLLDMCDMPLFKTLETTCSNTRKEIREAAEYQSEAGKFLFEKERDNLVPYLSNTSVRIDEMCSPLGLCCYDVSMGGYGALSFTLTTDPFGLKRETILDGAWDDDNSELHIHATTDNLALIQQHVQKGLPHAEVKEIVSDVNGIIKRIHISTSMPSDILHLTKTTEIHNR